MEMMKSSFDPEQSYILYIHDSQTSYQMLSLLYQTQSK